MNNKEYTELVGVGLFPNENPVPLDSPFIDERGVIQNLITNGIKSVTIITSKKGSIRSEHFHKIGGHYLYIISGEMNYWERNLDGSEARGPVLYRAGDMVFTGPQLVHKTEFVTDTVMLSLATLSNDHDNHEEDLVRQEF